MQGNGPPRCRRPRSLPWQRATRSRPSASRAKPPGLGLAEAKRLVENHENPAAGDFGHLPSGMPRNPMAEPGRVLQGGYKWLPVVIVVLAAVLAWLYFGEGRLKR
jgi:hypothetical protein